MNYHVNWKNFSDFNVSLDCVKIHEDIIVKGFTLSLHKRFNGYNRASKHETEKHSVYSGNISEKAKINVENLSEFPVTFCLFLPVVLGINGIIASAFIELSNISIT